MSEIQNNPNRPRKSRRKQAVAASMLGLALTAGVVRIAAGEGSNTIKAKAQVSVPKQPNKNTAVELETTSTTAEKPSTTSTTIAPVTTTTVKPAAPETTVTTEAPKPWEIEANELSNPKVGETRTYLPVSLSVHPDAELRSAPSLQATKLDHTSGLNIPVANPYLSKNGDFVCWWGGKLYCSNDFKNMGIFNGRTETPFTPSSVPMNSGQIIAVDEAGAYIAAAGNYNLSAKGLRVGQEVAGFTAVG